MVRRLDETIRSGSGGIAEYFRVEGRIYARQAAAHHGPAALDAVVVAIGRPRGGGAENRERGGHCKRCEGFSFNHGNLLVSPTRMSAVSLPGIVCRHVT
jgi:hypothetical protein